MNTAPEKPEAPTARNGQGSHKQGETVHQPEPQGSADHQQRATGTQTEVAR